MYRYADAFRCSRRNFLCFEESCRDLTQRPVRVDEKCLWREFSVFPYDGINTPDTVSQQYPELTKLCLRYFAQDKNTDSFRKQQAVPRFFSFRRFILENLRFLYLCRMSVCSYIFPNISHGRTALFHPAGVV